MRPDGDGQGRPHDEEPGRAWPPWDRSPTDHQMKLFMQFRQNDSCVTSTTIADRIASPELFLDAELLPHLICSLPESGGGDRDEAGKHGDTR